MGQQRRASAHVHRAFAPFSSHHLLRVQFVYHGRAMTCRTRALSAATIHGIPSIVGVEVIAIARLSDLLPLLVTMIMNLLDR